MDKLTRPHISECKQEAVRLVSSGQKVAAAAKGLGIGWINCCTTATAEPQLLYWSTPAHRPDSFLSS